MISYVELTNFKALQQTRIPLGGITVLAGTNSCGKSSIIQVLLALKQTFDDPHPNVALKLNGPLVKLGLLRDVVTNHDLSRDVGFGLEMDISPRPLRRYLALLGVPFDASKRLGLNVSISFRQEANNIVVSHYRVLYREHDGTELGGIDCRRVGDTYTVTFANMASVLEDYYPFFRNLRGRKMAMQPITFENAGLDFAGFIPISIGGSAFFGGLRSELKTRRLVDKSTALPGYLREEATGRFPLSSSLSYAVRDALRDAFARVSYLGPLREEPRRHYIYDQGTTLDIGNKGEYAAQILFSEQSSSVLHYPSVDSDQPETTTLLDAVRHWICGQFKMATDIKVDSVDPTIYQVKLGRGDDIPADVTISDVGFGVSQVLPIVVEGLRAKVDDTLVFEQPEIHLHPKVQSQLADFMICLSKAGRHVVVETHSDHFITRMRRRIAEDLSDDLERSLRIFFVKPSNGLSIVEPLEVDEFGSICNWPTDFFDQAEKELRLLAKAQLMKKRHKEAIKSEDHT